MMPSPQVEQVVGEFGEFRRGVFAGVLDDALAHLKSEVQPGKVQVALFELLDDAQRVEVVVEAVAVRAQQLVQASLAGVAERRVADVVHQRQGLGQVGIQPERAGHGAGDLGDLERMRQAVAEVVGVAFGEDLRLRLQAAKGARVDDAVAVAGVVTAVGVRRLGITAPAGAARVHRIGGQRHAAILLQIEAALDSRSGRRRVRSSRRGYPAAYRPPRQRWSPGNPS